MWWFESDSDVELKGYPEEDEENLAYDEEDEVEPDPRPSVVILGSGPNRIGQGIEFDACCVQACFALRARGYRVILVNSNPETVSTDYDVSDRLYFEPVVFENVLEVIEREITGVGSWGPERLQKAAEGSCAVLGDLGPEIQWITSYVSGAEVIR